MTTQAVTDIKELVGEMPARGCECDLNTCQHGESCSRTAAWVARMHVKKASGAHTSQVIAICDECLAAVRQRLARISSYGLTCSCGIPASSVGDLLGPVMPL